MATSQPLPVARARRRVPAWLIAGVIGAGIGVGATSLIDGSGTSTGAAAKANSVLSQPGTCVQDTPGATPGPGHC